LITAIDPLVIMIGTESINVAYTKNVIDPASDTIRSRTQHLRFHLLPADTLAEHVRWVAADAGLNVDEHGIEAALAQGGGSARDTLSALELIATAGDDGMGMSFDEFQECAGCGWLYWRGSHAARIEGLIERISAAGRRAGSTSA
jgi:DNA polymerase III delta prime subunit